MHYNDIDEIIKRSLQESERKSDDYAMEAKLRVWDAIEKPKKKSGLYLGFVLAMAAAFSFFLVSTFLFLKLQSRQEELVALKYDLNQPTPLSNLQRESSIPDENMKREKNPAVGEEQISEVNLEKTITKSNRQKLIHENAEKVAESRPEIAPLSQMVVEIPEPEIVFPELQTPEFRAELVSPQEIEVENQVESNPKSQKRLRFRLGNNSQNFSSGNSLAFNIKL